MPGFGEGLGQVFGGAMAADHLDKGLDNINSTAGTFNTNTHDYNSFGQSFLNPVTDTIGEAKAKAGSVEGYDDFAKRYSESPGVAYQREQAAEAQNNVAASRGGLLSGTNLRALKTIDNGIISTGMNTAYDEYLKGSNVQFGQLEQALGNMFSAIGVGTTATGQQAGVAGAEIGGEAKIAEAQAKNDMAKGSGLGSMFGGLGSLATMF